MSTRIPLVTIGVPVYNGERYLAACLDSLLAQTFEDFVIIVCDNASTDRTAEIVRDCCIRDARVRYHRNAENIGCPRNFVRVFELCETPYFRWAAADDVSAPESLERCMEAIASDPDVVQVYPRTLLINGDGNVTGTYADDVHAIAARPSERYRRVSERIRLCNAIYGVIRTDVLRRTGALGNYIGSDIVLQSELALYGKILELPEHLFLRRMHPDAQSAMSDEERARHYDPAAVEPQKSSQWRHLFERTRSVFRAPIGFSERVRVLKYLARNSIIFRHQFVAELLASARAALRQIGVHFGMLTEVAEETTRVLDSL
jgi:glycosyltransferase involved in cell wall biosynthesis